MSDSDNLQDSPLPVEEDPDLWHNPNPGNLDGFQWYVVQNPAWMGWELHCRRREGDHVQYLTGLQMQREPHNPAA